MYKNINLSKVTELAHTYVTMWTHFPNDFHSQQLSIKLLQVHAV